jgi:hypothetical protein
VYAIQTASGKRIHPGGRTALELHGLAHFLGLSTRAPVYLYGSPIVGREAAFALKGGTAINLFVRDLPRLSIDTT